MKKHNIPESINKKYHGFSVFFKNIKNDDKLEEIPPQMHNVRFVRYIDRLTPR